MLVKMELIYLLGIVVCSLGIGLLGYAIGRDRNVEPGVTHDFSYLVKESTKLTQLEKQLAKLKDEKESLVIQRKPKKNH